MEQVNNMHNHMASQRQELQELNRNAKRVKLKC